MQGALDEQQQAVGFKRLFHKVIGTVFHGLNRGFDIAVARNHDGGNLGVELANPFLQLQPVHVGFVHPDVKDDQRRRVFLQVFARLLSIGGGAAGVALVLQQVADHGANVLFVINNQNFRFHAVLLSI